MTDFDESVERYLRALQDFAKGNAKPIEDSFSKREDASLANLLWRNNAWVGSG